MEYLFDEIIHEIRLRHGGRREVAKVKKESVLQSTISISKTTFYLVDQPLFVNVWHIYFLLDLLPLTLAGFFICS
jgi:hypothetical protein